MQEHPFSPPEETAIAPRGAPGFCMGVDIVQISAIDASLDRFGSRFLTRLFTDGEIARSMRTPAPAARGLAACFAAKEAAIKAFGWSEAGVSWRDIEVECASDGQCALVFHSRAAALAVLGRCARVSLSVSHAGDYATAVVTASATVPDST